MKNRYEISLNFSAGVVINTESNITKKMIDDNMHWIDEIRQYIIDKTGLRTSGSIEIKLLGDDDEIPDDMEEIDL